MRKRTFFGICATLLLLSWFLYAFFFPDEKEGWHCRKTCVFQEGEKTIFVLEACYDTSEHVLTGSSDYVIEGSSIPAEDWQLSIYNEEVPFVAGGKAQAIKKNEIMKDEYGVWRVYLLQKPQDGIDYLLNTGDSAPIKLVLRLEEPEPYVIKWGNIFSSPIIKKL